MHRPWTDGPPVTTDLFTHLVQKRNILEPDRFIAPRWPDDLHDPFLLPDCEKAVDRIWRAISKQEKVGIVGDYDMDGTPGAALLTNFFHRCDCRPEVVIPTREEGYGFQSAFVERLAKLGVTLIITIDCGIRDHAATDAAAARGIDVIITDHHECAEILPKAYAVINPKRPDSTYPFRELCGTGVAFKLIQALVRRAPKEYAARVPENWLAWSLDLVAVATIADMVPLLDENRTLTYFGLKVLQKNHRPGLARLLAACDLNPEKMTQRDVAFKLVPKCNASGRMESMDDVYTLLVAEDPDTLEAAIQRILVRSTQSQLLLTTMLAEAKQKATTQLDASVMVMGDAAWHPGLTGLVASRLAEEYKRPVGVLAGMGESFRGSMRSIPGVSLPVLLGQVCDLLDRFGGHEQAAGLTVPAKKFEDLQRVLSSVSLAKQELAKVETDGVIRPEQVLVPSLEALERLAPWGMGHEEPIWSVNEVVFRDMRWLSDDKHLKTTVESRGQTLSAIMFDAARVKSQLNGSLDIYGNLGINEFRGKREPQLIIRGIYSHT